MAKAVYMPALGMNQETGTLLRWLKREGEPVQQGEPLMEIATDKTDVEIEAPASGILRDVRAREGDEVPVGQVIAQIVAAGEPAPIGAQTGNEPGAAASPKTETAKSISVSPVAARVAAEHGVDLQQVKPAGARIQKEDVLAHVAAHTANQEMHGRLPASPKARRLASAQGLTLDQIHGSGPDGAVLAADVLSTAEIARRHRGHSQSPQARTGETQGEWETIPMSRMWKVMAERLTQSWATVPQFSLARDIDASRLVAWRDELQARMTHKITYTDLLIKLAAGALAAHPRLNASWLNGTIVRNLAVNIGVAVAVEEGLLVPVIHAADQLGVGAIAQRRAELAQRSQAMTLSPEDLAGGTFTISNLGMVGVDRFRAIVNPPQAAILAVGRIAERVVAVGGQPAVRPMLSLDLSCDHRVVDGARAAQFLEHLAGLIEEPLRLLE